MCGVKMINHDTHHLVYPRRVHSVYKESAYIREALLARDIPRSIHEEIHANTSPIPLLGYHALKRIAGDMQPHYEHVQDGVADYLRAVEEANRHPRCKPMERELGELAIETLLEQMPYINDALPRYPKLHLIQGGLA